MSNLVYDKEKPGYVEPPKPQAPERPSPRPMYEGLLTEPTLPCTKCKGGGFTLRDGFSYIDFAGKPKSFPTEWKECVYCDARGWFHAPDIEAIIKAIKGRKPKTLRSKRPKDSRAYYVWRLSRFHGGKDVCLPMSAEVEITGDPYRFILDELARLIARAYFGSSNVGAARWQQAMYGSHEFANLPEVLDGPVHDGQKPLEEMLETV